MEREPKDTMPGEPHPHAARSHQSHTLAAPMLRFDIGAEAETLRRQDSYQAGSPTGRTLVKEPNLRIVLMALKSGARLEEHQASGPISVQPLEGIIRLRLAGGSVDLNPGELLMLEPGIAHDVEGVGDALFLLTIGRTTYDNVSDRHESRI